MVASRSVLQGIVKEVLKKKKKFFREKGNNASIDYILGKERKSIREK